MSNMSGIPDNKTFRSIIAPGELYSYIRAKLDLSGQLANDNVLYFNAENLLAYQNTHVFAYPNPNSYPKYHKIDQNVLIGEVVASSSPDMVYAAGEEGELRISGADMIAVSRSGGNATLILDDTAASFGLAAGDYIAVSGLSNAGFNTDAPQPIVSVAGVVSKVSGADIVSVERAAGVASITLSAAASTFGLATGNFVRISGITNDSNSFNTSVPVPITVSGSTFTYASTGGTATVVTEAATGASKDVSFPPRLTYANAGGVVSETAALGSSREVITPILLHIGGAYKPSSGSPSIDLWAGPTGNEPAPLSMAQLEHAQVCYYGSEPADPDSDPVLGKRKFLAVKLTGGNSSNKITRGVVSVLIKLYPKFW